MRPYLEDLVVDVMVIVTSLYRASSPVIDQKLCAILCILDRVLIIFPAHFGVHYTRFRKPRETKVFETHQMVTSSCWQHATRWRFFVHTAHILIIIKVAVHLGYGWVQLNCDGTRWRTGGEVKGKLANGVGSQYSSHYLGTWCIQHYYRWCAHLGCQQSTELTPCRFKWTRPFRWKTKSGFCACAITFQTQSTSLFSKTGGSYLSWSRGKEVNWFCSVMNDLKSFIIAVLWVNEISPALTSTLQHTSICHLKYVLHIHWTFLVRCSAWCVVTEAWDW